jgi:GT2 family glycosyltransferase
MSGVLLEESLAGNHLEGEQAAMEISVSILTYNRPDILAENLTGLIACLHELCEIIVVDNSTNDETRNLMETSFPQVRYVKNEANLGVAGRNRGLSIAHGDIVVTLDDDVTDLSMDDIRRLRQKFVENPQLGALCFRVLHYQTGMICNWSHPRMAELDGMGTFPTYEISEGAVAFRKEALHDTGLYFEKFFISHEGKDLAYRIMNQGYRVEYDGNISVIHRHAIAGRTNWRRYFFDTRNSFWIAVRNMPVLYGAVFLIRSLSAMLAYSLRDGYLKYWFKAIFEGVRSSREIAKTREPWAPFTKKMCREIDTHKPGFAYMIRKRLFRRGVEI